MCSSNLFYFFYFEASGLRYPSSINWPVIFLFSTKITCIPPRRFAEIISAPARGGAISLSQSAWFPRKETTYTKKKIVPYYFSSRHLNEWTSINRLENRSAQINGQEWLQNLSWRWELNFDSQIGCGKSRKAILICCEVSRRPETQHFL